VVVVCGEPGLGKTALTDSAIGSASGFRVARTGGVESETELAFAALQRRVIQLTEQLPIDPNTRGAAHLLAGELSVAASMGEELTAVIESTRADIAPYAALTGFQRRQAEASEMLEAGETEASDGARAEG
jgi:hypothetical protein